MVLTVWSASKTSVQINLLNSGHLPDSEVHSLETSQGMATVRLLYAFRMSQRPEKPL